MNTQALADLLPCPLCGSPAEVSTVTSLGYPYEHSVNCTNVDCHISTPFAYGNYAITAWNTRQAASGVVVVAWVDPKDAMFTAPPWRATTPLLYSKQETSDLIPLYTALPAAGRGGTLNTLYDTAATGFHTSESCGPDRKYLHKISFPTLEALHAYEDAWTKAMVGVRDSR